jgi:hypothetical protein
LLLRERPFRVAPDFEDAVGRRTPRKEAMPAKRKAWVLAAISVLTASLLGTSSALAAAPTATTSPATNITSTGATLNGTVSPNKTATAYHFEYGPSPSLGTKTAPATVNGNAAKSVSASVTGLAPATKYYFRIVASNASGAATGTEQSFTTPLVGVGGPNKNSVSIGAAPHTVIWGHTAQISGQLTGPGKAGKTVLLKSSPYPYTTGFKPTGQTTTTSATGAYAFTVAPGRNTRYQVTVTTKIPATSGVATVGVHVKVGIHVSTLRPARGSLVRFFGTVTPAHNGRNAQIQRRTSTGAWRTVASTRLVAGGVVNGVAVSRYSKKVRVRFSGTYRVRVNPRDGNHLVGNSATRRERVR